jgi:hypothetical protein
VFGRLSSNQSKQLQLQLILPAASRKASSAPGVSGLGVLALLSSVILRSSIMIPFNPRAVAPPVEGKPYIAKFLCHRGDEAMSYGDVFRDSKGRTRIDYYDEHGTLQLRVIDDVPQLRVSFVGPGGQLAVTEQYTAAPIGWGYRSVKPIHTDEVMTLHGVKCTRIWLQSLENRGEPLTEAGEVWISTSLGIVMKDVNMRDQWTWEITQIQFREPLPNAFNLDEKTAN